jgi:predicted transposase/invertase (TIGR01784 family)
MINTPPKTLQSLNLKDDFLFSKVMSDLDICKEFLEELLQIDIKKVEMAETEKQIRLNLDNKSIRLDVYVNDENGTVYNIEMQQGNNPKNLPQRLRYYQGNIDLHLLEKGVDYRELKKSYVIFICTFDSFGKGRHQYTFKNVCLEDTDIILEDDATKIILNTQGTLNDVPNGLIEFLNYVEHTTDTVANTSNSELVKHIHQKVLKVKNNHETEREFMTLLERFDEIREEGRIEGLKETAKNMLRQGCEEIFIAKITGLDMDTIKTLKADKNTK